MGGGLYGMFLGYMGRDTKLCTTLPPSDRLGCQHCSSRREKPPTTTVVTSTQLLFEGKKKTESKK